MISISLDLGNVPSVLAAMSDPRVAQHVANAAAESYVDDVHDWIDAGKGFTPRTGHLQQSINWHGNGNGSAVIYANAEYAGWVEEGNGAMTQLHNEFIKYIGEADAAGGATAKLASGIQFAAQNFKPLAETAITLATIYGVTLLQGLVNAGAAMADNILAARTKLAADRELLAGEIMLADYQAKLAASNLLAAKAAMDTAIAQKKATTGFFETAIAAKAAAEATQAYYLASTAAAEKQAALAALTEKTAAATTLASKAAGLLNSALNIFIAWEIGTAVGEWLNRFELVRAAGVRMAETFVIAKTAIAGLLSGNSFSEISKEIDQVKKDFDQLAEATTEKAVAAEQKKNESAKQSVQLMQLQSAAADKLAKNYLALADAAESSAQQQLLKITDKQQLAVRGVDIRSADTSGVDRSAQREREITQVMIDAASERQKIEEDSAKKRLDLIDKAHKAEVDAAEKSKKDTAEIDQKWLQSKQKVLSDWQSGTRKTIDELIALEKKHRDAAVQADQDIADNRLAIKNKSEELLGTNVVKNAGDLTIQRGKASMLNGDVVKAEKAGDTAAALAAAKKVQTAYIAVAEAAKAAFDQGIVDESAVKIGVYDMQQAAKKVEQLTAQQGEADRQKADETQAAIAEQLISLQQANAAADQLQAKLAKGTALQIKVEKGELDTAMSMIESIPAEKTITLHVNTVKEGEAVPAAPDPGKGGASFLDNIPGHADGVRLPGFGGGDRHPALLESGEGVVNKDGLRALDAAFGPGFFDGINAGASPIELLRKHASTLKLAEGGRISVSMPNLDVGKISNANAGTPINIHLPGGEKFGPFSGSGDSAAALEAALNREVLRRGRRS